MALKNETNIEDNVMKKEQQMQLIRVLTMLAAVLTAVSCIREPSTEGAPSAAQPTEHASAAVKPGSHDDWCGEHRVPESMCTRCNSSLIAAFKATNDWCAEHGLPESQCLKCNPDLKIVRPPAGQ